MRRSSKKMVAVITTLATLAGQAAPAIACGGGGGGRYGGGFGGGYGGGRVISQPAVSYSSPISYPSSSYGSYGHSQATYSQPTYGYSASVAMQSQMPQTQVAQARPIQSQVGRSQPTQVQAVSAQMPQSNALQSNAAENTPTQTNTAQGGNGVTGNPVTQNSGTQTQQPASNSTVNQNLDATSTSEQSALQMLASLAAPTAAASDNQASSATMPEFAPKGNNSPVHVGTWTATLPNNASIQLQLGEDGRFNWTATQKGKSSTFAGEYTVIGGRLTLVRSGDRQELKGSWSGNDQTGFNFKLEGAKDNGLDFQRA